VVVSWSRHELKVIQEWSPHLVSGYAEVARDAKPLAERWLRRVHPSVELPRSRMRGRYQLAPIMKLAGYSVPTSHGPDLVGKRIRDLRKALASHGGRFDELTPVAKAKWTNLLLHNRHDCFGLRHVCEVAARDLARDERVHPDP
jgi:hypothetical protein